MSLHRLTSITIGVPNPDATSAYYVDFGLTRSNASTTAATWLATRDGGDQLEIVHAPRRRLERIGIGVHDADDVDRIDRSLQALGISAERTDQSMMVRDPSSQLTVSVEVAPHLEQTPVTQELTNGPGRADRAGTRAEAISRDEDVSPRKLGHIVIGSINYEQTQRFFVEGLGFKVSDQIAGRGSFLRCSTDHHNVLIQQTPLNFLHHTAWEVDDVDEVGRGATAMLVENPERHVWGLGRHHLGSNFFWYLKDPAGNFSEYYSDLDCIVDDALWEPSEVAGARGLYSWGPPPPPSFLAPEDLAALMTGAHSQ